MLLQMLCKVHFDSVSSKKIWKKVRAIPLALAAKQMPTGAGKFGAGLEVG